MKEEELKKMIEDPVYFTEEYFGVKLTAWQKTYLRIQMKLKPLSRFRRY